MKRVIRILCPFIAMALSLSFSSCSNDDNDSKSNLDKTEVTLYVEETTSLTYSGGDCIWTSDNTLIASVDDGVVTANHVGETIIHANEADCKVTVKPRYTKYHDPYIKWGVGKDEVKQYMEGYELSKEDDDQLTYQGDSSILLYTYTFDNGELNASGFLTNLSESSYLVDYLLERYIPLSTDGTTFVFMAPDKETGIGLQLYSSYILVAYLPYNFSTKSLGTTIQDILSDINQKIGPL